MDPTSILPVSIAWRHVWPAASLRVAVGAVSVAVALVRESSADAETPLTGRMFGK